MMNRTEVYSATLSLALIELENYNVVIDDFNSLLEEIARVLDQVFKDMDLKPVSTSLVKDRLMKNLNSYANSLNNLEKLRIDYASKLKPFLSDYHENRDLYFKANKELASKIKKYQTKIKEYRNKCIKYLTENGVNIYNNAELESNNNAEF